MASDLLNEQRRATTDLQPQREMLNCLALTLLAHIALTQAVKAWLNQQGWL